MKNVTISLDDHTHRRARIRAAELGKSLSGLVRDLLENLDGAAGPGEEIMPSGITRSEFERLHREELELRKKLLEKPTGFRASDRLTRDEVHDRARARKEWNEAHGRRS
jgi:plasmid stability protein